MIFIVNLWCIEEDFIQKVNCQKIPSKSRFPTAKKKDSEDSATSQVSYNTRQRQYSDISSFFGIIKLSLISQYICYTADSRIRWHLKKGYIAFYLPFDSKIRRNLTEVQVILMPIHAVNGVNKTV